MPGVLGSILGRSLNRRCWQNCDDENADYVSKEIGNSLPLLAARGSNLEGTPVHREKVPMPSLAQSGYTIFSGESRSQILDI